MKNRSRPVSRVLSRRKTGGGGHSSRTRVAARLQRAVPGGMGRAALHPPCGGIASLFALAPGGVCRAAPVTRGAVRSYRTVSPLPRALSREPFGGLLSVALSCGSPRPVVNRHPALWCPDFPRRPCGRRVRPGGSGEGDLTRAMGPGNSGPSAGSAAGSGAPRAARLAEAAVRASSFEPDPAPRFAPSTFPTGPARNSSRTALALSSPAPPSARAAPVPAPSGPPGGGPSSRRRPRRRRRSSRRAGLPRAPRDT
jgi:hypothetical protein